ncbi:uncharacterized protein BDR25DRAFT_372506 [Lindgomyces ingoldianus]|uniref:Uncharacterized protein n=1 Tax=Lindgomyces ingoldianus TaxID=673940 RepID=A0ACB6QQ52_9PLEO|nr:uncharacterized protein BDR25DRAFT_372506 [Lindgomyces ingoldianus]KAF2468698.1 hypothetical protein BDR25DRAFT_372506 [Lindgomyces ingoldianus]
MKSLFFVASPALVNVQGVIARAALPSETRSYVPPSNTTSTARISSASPSPTPFWPTAVLPKFHPQFRDIPDSALSCWKSWGDYQLRTQVPNPGIIANATTSVWWSPLPTPITVIEDNSYCSADVKKIPISLTTLCDGVPRASYIEESSSWTLNTWIVNYTQTDSLTMTVIPGTTRPGYENEQPKCTIAPNSVPLCDEVNSAYTWWLSSRGSQTPPLNEASTTTTPTKSLIETLVPPSCIQFIPAPPQAKPTCAMEIDNQEVWYWPAPGPTGSDFCNSSWAPPTATPTIPGKPNTAVVSGMTFTSPSVYHLIKSVTVYTLAGTNRKADSGYIRHTSVWKPSTTIGPEKTFLTDKQLETDIVSVTYIGPKHPHGAAVYSYNKDFRLNDIFTMRSGPYFGNPEHQGISTIFQNEVQHSFGLGVPELVSQNKIFKECEWTRTYTRDVYPSEYPVAVDNSVLRSNFHPITTGTGGMSTPTVPPVPTSTPSVTTPLPPLCKL